MDNEANKALARRFYERVVSTGDLDALAEVISADYVEVHGGKRYPVGIEGAREHVRGVRLTYPDLRLEVEQQIAEGEWVVSRVTMRGTHVGEWLGIAPTGKPVEMTAVNVDRIVDGRIVEHGGAADSLGPLLEIGAVRPVAAQPARTPVADVLWRRLDLPGHEACRLLAIGEAGERGTATPASGDGERGSAGSGRLPEGWRLCGTATFAHEGCPCLLDYRVDCDPGWHTRAARISGWIGQRELSIGIAVELSDDGARRWRLDGVEVPAVADCVDLDLGFTPATNLLPIRRLALPVGGDAEVTAAWLSFPQLDLRPLPQRYLREDDLRYRYESNDGRFSTTLRVDAAGMPVDYPGLWQAVTGHP